ncbi:hypothetical protein FRC03_004205 [Tulasnella sp. 419]|nr:hypothetical protein FRC03_004205 [Tulasnella sp. 419]
MVSASSLISLTVNSINSQPAMESSAQVDGDSCQVRSVPRLRCCKGRFFRPSNSALTSTTPGISISADNLQSATPSSYESSKTLPLTTSSNASLRPVVQFYERTSAASEDSMGALSDVDEVGPHRTTFVFGDYFGDCSASDGVHPGDDNEDSMSSGYSFIALKGYKTWVGDRLKRKEEVEQTCRPMYRPGFSPVLSTYTGATFGELGSSVARFSTLSFKDVPLNDSDAGSVVSDDIHSQQPSFDSQDMDEDAAVLEFRSVEQSPEMVYRDKYDGLFAPSRDERVGSGESGWRYCVQADTKYLERTKRESLVREELKSLCLAVTIRI